MKKLATEAQNAAPAPTQRQRMASGCRALRSESVSPRLSEIANIPSDLSRAGVDLQIRPHEPGYCIEFGSLNFGCGNDEVPPVVTARSGGEIATHFFSQSSFAPDACAGKFPFDDIIAYLRRH